VVGVAGVGLVVVATAAASIFYLATAGGKADWLAISKEALKITFQALAIGALGGLVKLIIDRRNAEVAKEEEHRRRDELAMADERKAAEIAGTELRDRRYRFIISLVELARAVDEARLVIRANRSVKSWTEVTIDRIIPARSRIRLVIHELQNWAEAGSHVFGDLSGLNDHLEEMDKYLVRLLDEFAGNKQNFGEVQDEAEAAKGNREERDRLPNKIWSKMTGLEHWGDLIKDGAETAPSARTTRTRC
jgi:hypothetical protein